MSRRKRSRNKKKVEAAPHPEVEVFRQLAKAESVDDFLAVAPYAAEEKLKAQHRMCAALLGSGLLALVPILVPDLGPASAQARAKWNMMFAYGSKGRIFRSVL